MAAYEMFGTALQLREGGVVDTGREPGAWTVSGFRARHDRDVHADVWERHPAADEVRCVLSGVLHVHLRDDADGAGPHATLTAGTSFVVPANTWHRLEVGEPAELLTISPRGGTEHEPVAAPPAG